jgi:branched-chain amino acid transport system substrate-binding protein
VKRSPGLATFLAAVACAFAIGPVRAAPNAITVAQVAPLSGILASSGQQMVLGGKIYFDWVNEHGGVNGQQIKVLVADDAYKVPETVRLTTEMLANPEVVALFGFAGTANIGQLLADKVLEKGGAPLVAPFTGGEPLRSPYNPWIFHLRASYADEAEHMVQQLTTLGMTRIAVMYQDDGFGLSGLKGVQDAAAKRNLKLVATAGYERNTDKVDAAVEKTRATDAQAVIMIAVNKPAAAFVRKYRQSGGGAQLFNISVVDPNEIVKLAGVENAHGLAISQVVPYPYMANLPVIREYQELLKKYAPKERVNYTSFEEFLGAKVLVEGLRRAGPNPTRAGVIKGLESLHEFDLGGVRVNYGPQNRVGSKLVDITVIDSSGKLLK